MPGGMMGVQLKSNVPCSCAHANRLGLMHEPQSKLSDSSACRRSQSQRWIGKSVLHKLVMK